MHHSPVAPTGPITCVFTDIIDSTSIWEAYPEEMWEALQTHNKLMREELLRCKGYEVKTMGDAFHLVFSDAESALRFCFHMQVTLSNTAWPPSIVAYHKGKLRFDEMDQKPPYPGLTVRMGIHFGQPYGEELNPVSERVDYYGSMVNRSSRVQGEAQGGEIAVTDEFIEQLRQCRMKDKQLKEDLTGPLNDVIREKILLETMEPPVGAFEVKQDVKRSKKLKGVEKPVYITRIGLIKPPQKDELCETGSSEYPVLASSWWHRALNRRN
jgi:adenylate cyclase